MTLDTGTDPQVRPRASDGNDAPTMERQQAASTAADESKHVVGVAAGEAKNVAAEAADHARNLVGDARNQLQGQAEEQTRAQKDALASALATFGDDLASMARDSSGLAADVAHEVADRARALSSNLGSKEPVELLGDVRRFARQRPGTFLLGALAAGLVVGRLARGTKDAIEASKGEPSITSGATDAGTAPVGEGIPDTPDTSSAYDTHAQSPQSPEPFGDPQAPATEYSSPIQTGVTSSPTGEPATGPAL